MRNKFVYSCYKINKQKKIHASRYHKLLDNIFCILLVVEAFFLQKVIKLLEEVLSGWQEVR